MAALAAVPAMCGMRGFLSSMAKTAPATDPMPAAMNKNVSVTVYRNLLFILFVRGVPGTLLLRACCKGLCKKSFLPAVCQRAAGAFEWHGVSKASICHTWQ